MTGINPACCAADPDDPNYTHPVRHENYCYDLFTPPPKVWARLNPSDLEPGQAPYIHHPRAVSWKHPNNKEIIDIIKAGGKRNQIATRKDCTKTVKKLRILLQAGAPLGAVEQKAKLEGVDMAVVLSPRKYGEDKIYFTGNDENIPLPLLKKYKRMMKAGVPISNVQQLAAFEANVSQEILLSNLGFDCINDGGNKKAIIADLVTSQTGHMPTGKMKAEDSGSTIDMSAQSRAKQYFVPLPGGKVSFPSSSHSNTSFPLTELVRKMVHTVDKTSRFDSSPCNEMIVDESTLYNALGAFKGVRFALCEFNSSIGYTEWSRESQDMVHAKRHGFLEMSRSLGLNFDSSDVLVDICGLAELISHLEATKKNELERGRLILKDGLYDFDSLHLIYSPGSYVIAKHVCGGSIDCFAQVVWNRYTQGKTITGKQTKYFQLCVRFIVPVGGGSTTFAEVVEGIDMFEGRRSLLDSVVGAGLAFVPPADNDYPRLIQQYSLRGVMYNSLSKEGNHTYMEYDKGSFFQKRNFSTSSGNNSISTASCGRIIVDFDGAADYGHSLSIGRDDMIDGIKLKMKEYKLHLSSVKQNKNDDEHSMILFSKIPEEYLSLAWPATVGYSLTTKSWGDIILDGLKEVKFDPDIFNRLVIPESRKRMIKALVKHTNVDGGFHDLVDGKGEGTVFLLYGEPGNGKTLTAEATAEFLCRPLYSVSMGTLGTTADELETRLSEILVLSSKWNAPVLLDEADSFLEARSSNSPLERNSMVSVMLRLLEYHKGTLFLTSNRIECIDPAFQTRITLALRYDSLDSDGRAAVWTNLLQKSGFGSFLDNIIDVKALAAPSLNGREIKNALRLAMAMAADEDVAISQELLLEAVMVIIEYKESMKGDWSGRKHKKFNRLGLGRFLSLWR